MLSLAWIVVANASPMAWAEDSSFVSLSFEKACARAEEEGKDVFVDFYTTWCGPCRMLDKMTWNNKEVAAWLVTRTVAIKLDAEQHERLADRYHVDSYPTLLFIRPDGTEMDRIVGYVAPAEFLSEAEAILAGKDALTRAKEKLEREGINNPMARHTYAQVLAAKGEHAEALEHYLWCFDEGLKHSRAFVGVRLSFLLSSISRLGQVYPPAFAALRERRDTAEDSLTAGRGDLYVVMDYCSLNETLGETKRSLALYDRLRADQADAEVVQLLVGQLMDTLRESRRYDEIFAQLDLRKAIDSELRQLNPSSFARLLRRLWSTEMHEQISDYERGLALRNLAQYYEIYIGVGRHEEAAELADRLLAIDDSAITYNNLAWAGYLTGRPTEANLEQARKAYELTEGMEPAVIDTLARLLDAFDRTEEAHGVLRTALAGSQDDVSRQILETTLRDLGGTGSDRYAPRIVWILLVIPLIAAGVVVAFRRYRKPAGDGLKQMPT